MLQIYEEKKIINEIENMSENFDKVPLESTRNNENKRKENTEIENSTSSISQINSRYEIKNKKKRICKYKRKMLQVVKTIDLLMERRKIKIESKSIEMLIQEIETIYKNQLENYEMEKKLYSIKQDQIVNKNMEYVKNCINKEGRIIQKLENSLKLYPDINYSYQKREISSSETNTDQIICEYEEKLHKYRRYIEIIKIEHQEQLNQYDIILENKIKQIENFFQMREEDIQFECDLKIKEIILKHKQTISQLETEFINKHENEIKSYIKKIEQQKQKYHDTISHFQDELAYREKNISILSHKYSVLLELKDYFLNKKEYFLM